MRGAARAIGWDLFRHHRLGLVVLGTCTFAFWVLKRFAFPEAALRFDPPNEVAGFFMAPFTIAFFFFTAAFSYGLSGDLAARESPFPKRMFVLPVRTLELAGWPMLYGTVASVCLWIITLALAEASGGVKGHGLPRVWPALTIAAFLAWMQALTWLSYPFRGMRLVVAVLVLVTTDATVLLAIAFHATEATMVAILVPQIVAAYVIGYWAVGRARRGIVPEWRVGRIEAGERKQQPPFSSATRAQAWFEWRRHGRTLPTMVLFVVPCELALLFLPGNHTAGMVFFILFVVVITPPFLSMMAAPAMSAVSTHGATRPMTTVQLVVAKLEMTAWSTALAWLITGLFTVAFLEMSGTMALVAGKMRDYEEVSGMARAIVVPLVVLAALVLWTWRSLVQSLCIGLTGNPWLIRSTVLAALTGLCFLFPVLWAVVSNDRIQKFVWDYLPLMLAALVSLKMTAAAWVAIRLHDRGVMTSRAIVGGIAAWLVAAALLYALLAWIGDSPIFPFYFVASIAILMVPLARLAAAPLALAGSRQR